MRVVNYKGFDDSGVVTFGERLNIITGQNNSGKTALFECLDLSRFSNKPHRSITQTTAVINPVSSVEISASFTGNEIYNAFMLHNSFMLSFDLSDYSAASATKKLDSLFHAESINVNLKAAENLNWRAGNPQSGNVFPARNQSNRFNFLPSADRQTYQIQGPINGGEDQVLRRTW
jgi:hypothetical protein